MAATFIIGFILSVFILNLFLMYQNDEARSKQKIERELDHKFGKNLNQYKDQSWTK